MGAEASVRRTGLRIVKIRDNGRWTAYEYNVFKLGRQSQRPTTHQTLVKASINVFPHPASSCRLWRCGEFTDYRMFSHLHLDRDGSVFCLGDDGNIPTTNAIYFTQDELC
jgi:hypothetical protein